LFLAAARERDPNSLESLFEHLKSLIEATRLQYLYLTPGGKVTQAKANIEWVRLIGLIGQAAERLWRDDFIRDPTIPSARKRLLGDGESEDETSTVEAEQGHLELLIRQARLLMQLWVEASLYRLRAVNNFRVQGKVVAARKRSFGIKAQVAKV